MLGFDAGCMTCSDLATRIEEAVGDKLEIRSLHDPLVEHWREMALGKEAPWAPTLFEVRGDKVKAWTGTMMGVRLGRVLGPVATWRILQTLGELRTVRVGGTAMEQRTRMTAGISRGQFLKGLGGAVTAISLMAGTGLSQAAVANENLSTSKGTRAQRDVVEKVVRSSKQFKNLERKLGQRFDFGRAKFAFDERLHTAAVAVPTRVANGNGAAAIFFVELRDRAVSFYRHLVAEGGEENRYEVTAYENGKSLGQTVVGPTHVVTPDGQRFTREQFQKEASRLARANSSTQRTYAGRCSNCRYYRTRRCRWIVNSTCIIGGYLNPTAGAICTFVYFYGSTISDGCEAWARSTCYKDGYC